jgi:hypothetical protein
MGTSAIALSASDITALQNDVNELNTKLNALIAEFNKCSDDTTVNAGKIDVLLDKISDGYTATQTTGTGSASDAILERLSDLDADYKKLNDDFDTHLTSHPATGSGGSGRSGSRSSGGNLGDRSIDITATTGVGADTSVNANDASVTGSYGAAETKVITIGAKGEVRARRLARQTLNRLRK